MRDTSDGEHTPPHEIVAHVKDTLDDFGSTRRSFLAGTGTILGAGALSGTALAGGDDDEHGDGHGGDNGDDGMSGMTDVDILNYALTLEHLEDVFYREGLERYTKDEVMHSSVYQHRFGEFIQDDLYANLELVGEHESTHVEALTATIEELGGEPVPECTYDFGYSTFHEFLDTAALLENTGVKAYNGALAMIEDPALQTTGATIATVEGRHASYLNLLTGEVPFPAAFDEAAPMEDILEAAGGFITECPDGMEMDDSSNGDDDH
ncbi:ferritin-like domain-containing protein [Halostella sp. JP-L12]|uniref:ferritin-like domain-containing protein n=1 Tax=Halostella TaxID=1843185 RepID=UPI000EF842FA|nr:MULTISPECIES: ferritin-like domain-containing protein [Halostella]NHN48776.1 ferritin-like domain-containing protein [Halostella sp. JP-L12]